MSQINIYIGTDDWGEHGVASETFSIAPQPPAIADQNTEPADFADSPPEPPVLMQESDAASWGDALSELAPEPPLESTESSEPGGVGNAPAPPAEVGAGAEFTPEDTPLPPSLEDADASEAGMVFDSAPSPPSESETYNTDAAAENMSEDTPLPPTDIDEMPEAEEGIPQPPEE